MAKNRLDYEAHLSRHSHNIDAGYSASLAPGMIIPQYFDVLQPGDSVYYNTKMFARLQDVVTAFLGEIDMHVDYFFVPLQMLYTPFGQIFAQTDDYLSSLYKNLDKSSFPLYQAVDWTRTDPRTTFMTGRVECLAKERMRLFDALDLNPLAAYVNPDSEEAITNLQPLNLYMYQPNVSPWIFCAYQAIYQKFYRNDEFEKLEVQDYNFDEYWEQTSFSNDRFNRLRYVQRPSDYFTTMRPSPISSAINSMGSVVAGGSTNLSAGLSSLNSALQETNNWLGDNGDGLVSGVSRVGNVNLLANRLDYGQTNFQSAFEQTSIALVDGASGSQFVSAANIRTMFALDKFLRIYGRAGKTYDAQIEAHFGIKIPHDVKHDATRLKSYHFVLQSDPVYSTSNIQNSDDPTSLVSTIGQVGGQSVGELNTLSGDPEKFTAPVHGVFMAVAYAVTKPRYWGTFSKLHLLNNRLSFPIPEFDKLGAQPLFAFETIPSSLDPDKINVRVGWQNRYQEFKKKYNRCSIVYANFNDLPETPAVGPDPVFGENVYSPWVISRIPFKYSQGVTSLCMPSNNFFEVPTALDNIMVQPLVGSWQDGWNKNPWLVFQSDPILTEFYCKCKKVSWMSETGEPDL